MPADVKIQDFRRQLGQLGSKFGPRAVRFATAGAARIIRDEAKRTAPKRTGILRKAIYAGRSRRQSNNTREWHRVTVYGGPTRRVTKKGKVTDAYYWRWVEAGYKAVGSKKNGPGRQIRGQGFLRKSFNKAGTRAISEFEKRLDAKTKELNASVR